MNEITLIFTTIGRFLEHMLVSYPALMLGGLAVIFVLVAFSRFSKPKARQRRIIRNRSGGKPVLWVIGFVVYSLFIVAVAKAEDMPHDRYTVPGEECPAWVLLANEGTCGGES